MTQAVASYTGTVTEARVTFGSSHITYQAFEPEGIVVFLDPHSVDEDGDQLEAIRANVSRLWGRDWDSAEDSVYDAW